jgi:hypothetical protein
MPIISMTPKHLHCFLSCLFFQALSSLLTMTLSRVLSELEVSDIVMIMAQITSLMSMTLSINHDRMKSIGSLVISRNQSVRISI